MRHTVPARSWARVSEHFFRHCFSRLGWRISLPAYTHSRSIRRAGLLYYEPAVVLPVQVD